MHAPLIADIPYRASPLDLYAPVAGEPWALLLDSGATGAGAAHPLARWDIVVASPVTTVVTRGAVTEVARSEPAPGRPAYDLLQGDPLSVARRELERATPDFAAFAGGPALADPPPLGGGVADALPFTGGLVGYFGYDLARRYHRLPETARDDSHWPEMAVGIYRWAALTDHRNRRSLLVAHDAGLLDSLREHYARFARTPDAAAFSLGEARSNLGREGYLAALARVSRALRDGEVYQVNLAQRFRASFSGEPLALHAALRARAPGPFGAFLDLPFGQVASVSPERFLSLRAGMVETRPIKGTRPRDPDPSVDARLARELATSPKELAENVMIVDLLRNDLGQCARPGSVRVPRRFEVESFPTVHHLVSTVTAELASGRDAFDLLRACFPGGSITGAPKLQAMRIIESLEPHRRGVYCGSIGHVGFDGSMDMSIAIRTATVREGIADYWAGGGIVHDSDPAFEYAESLGKASPFLSLCA